MSDRQQPPEAQPEQKCSCGHSPDRHYVGGTGPCLDCGSGCPFYEPPAAAAHHTAALEQERDEAREKAEMFFGQMREGKQRIVRLLELLREVLPFLLGARGEYQYMTAVGMPHKELAERAIGKLTDLLRRIEEEAGKMSDSYPNCPDCGERAVCSKCGETATYQTPFDKVFWDSNVHYWKCQTCTQGKP